MPFWESMSFLRIRSKQFSVHRRFKKFLSQPFHVAEVFTGVAGQYVPVKDTIRGFKMILDGEFDEVAENDFYMKGGTDGVIGEDKSS